MRRALAALALAFLSGAGPATGFVVQGPRQSTGDPIQDFRLAPRWDAGTETLIGDGVRGLGGGLEYVVDDSVCDLRFIDIVSCDDVKAVIAEAAARWAAGHARLYFEDITGDVEPSRPRRSPNGRIEGAELDIFAANARAFPRFVNRAITAYTVLYSEPVALVLSSNGAVRSLDGRASSADMWLNADRCYFLDPYFPNPGDCVHFGSVVQHELAHVIGLDHPDAAASRNLDTNAIVGDAMVFDCRDPSFDLVVNPDIDRFATAIGVNVDTPDRWLRGLSPDDIGGRDALYPTCEAAPVEVARADLSSSSDTAEDTATGPCIAFARGSDGPISARGDTKDAARTAARFACGMTCEVGEAVCFDAR